MADATTHEWLTLDDDEEILWENSPTLITAAGELVTGIALCLTLLLAPIGLLMIASAYLQVKNRDYVVTNKKFYKKTGVLSTDTDETALGNMQNLSYSQSFVGGMFDYGTVEISDASGTIAFKNVKNPGEVKETLTEISNEYGKRYGTSSGQGSSRSTGSVTGDVDRLYDELRQANEAMEDLLGK